MKKHSTGNGSVLSGNVGKDEVLTKHIQGGDALLLMVIQNTFDPVYIKDREGRILICNSALEKVVGRPVTEIVGKTDSEYYEDPAVGEKLRENDLFVMKSGKSQIVEETVNTPLGLR